MDSTERRALTGLRKIDWAPTQNAVWQAPTAHVAKMNRGVLDKVIGAYLEARSDEGAAPLGVVVTGQHGSGKTHLLTAARVEVQRLGGYFFLISLTDDKRFWQNALQALRSGLYRTDQEDTSQLVLFLHRLCDRLVLSDSLRKQVVGTEQITKEALDQVVRALRNTAPVQGMECRHTVRALILLAANDLTLQDIGESYLSSNSESTAGERAAWGIQRDSKQPQEMVHEISALLAMTGASMVAIDQIDALITQAGLSANNDIPAPQHERLEEIGNGLMELRQFLQRSLLVVACQQNAWTGIRSVAHAAASDRFRRPYSLFTVSSAEIGEELVAARFALRFTELGFTPPYPTWPVRQTAFAGAKHYTPRELFKRIDEHIESCLLSESVTELASLDEVVVTPPPLPVPPKPSFPSDQPLPLDQRFEELLGKVNIDQAVDKDGEDKRMPELLSAALAAYRHEQGERGSAYEVERNDWGSNPAMHAQIRLILDEKSESGITWSFRGLATGAPIAAQNRITRLQGVTGLNPDNDRNRVYLLRTGTWAMHTTKTRIVLTEFRNAGGVLVDKVDLADLRTFAALERMFHQETPELHEWLLLRKPASRTTLFRRVFGDPDAAPPATPPPLPQDGPQDNPRDTAPDVAVDEASPQDWPTHDPDHARPRPPTPPDSISLGDRQDTGDPVHVPLESLRKHTVIFAGSGSGKTVLIRRIIEECALQGVSAIVLDPNNDLARLGESWPHEPATWLPGDAEKAADYLDGTEVVVWTPRREAGRPISFQPLPDFADVLNDQDEFSQALEMAVDALAPRARADGTTARADRARAVLREALSSFAQAGGSGLKSFLEYLSDLPEDSTQLANGTALAAELSQTLLAATINDPLFGGAGTPLDPGVLLTPPPGKRARISVISMIGLPTDEQRRSFVNQLQTALFAWIKANPAGDRPLGGLFVMDEAQTLAPSGMVTACTTSTLALASQARKYGLGLVFATQAPKGIHNQIVGNAATQYFGFINAPVQVAAAKEMAAAKSSAVLDISRLKAGEFYAVAEGQPFQKVKSPMCLSHHPSSALTAEDVLLRSRAE